MHAKIDTEPVEKLEVAPAFSEMDLALKFTARHADELRYVAMWNKWYRYDGKVWRPDETRKTFSLACDLCRKASWETNKKQERKGLASAKTRAAVVALAGEDRRLAATVDQWDADPWLLNTPDGVIDLRTSQRRDHRTDDYITKITSVTPDANCLTPLWSAFLDRVTAGDEDLQAFLARLGGIVTANGIRLNRLLIASSTARRPGSWAISWSRNIPAFSRG
jgi:putative DNA primase/helicase